MLRLPIAAAGSSSGVAICYTYVFPVLWMTPYFHRRYGTGDEEGCKRLIKPEAESDLYDCLVLHVIRFNTR